MVNVILGIEECSFHLRPYGLLTFWLLPPIVRPIASDLQVLVVLDSGHYFLLRVHTDDLSFHDMVQSADKYCRVGNERRMPENQE